MGSVVVQIFVNKQGLGGALIKVSTPNMGLLFCAVLYADKQVFSLVLYPRGMYTTSSGRVYLPHTNFSQVCCSLFPFMLLCSNRTFTEVIFLGNSM